MEEIWQSILLGAIQGVAEFLPISSSGHLAIAERLFGLRDMPPLFSVFLHLATLCTVILFFRKQIWQLVCAFLRLIFHKPVALSQRDAEKDARRYILAIVIASIPTAIIGIVMEKCLPSLPLRAIFIGFFVTSALLLCSGAVLKKRTANAPQGNGALEKRAPAWWQALLVGLFQGVGTLPGVSRSGSTIAGALFSGVTREIAGEFSFIISIPAVLGAFLLEVKDISRLKEAMSIWALAAGFVTAFAVGYVSLWLLMKIIKRGRLEFFACYLVPVGILGLLFLR